jgi:hypothetical protein
MRIQAMSRIMYIQEMILPEFHQWVIVYHLGLRFP